MILFSWFELKVFTKEKKKRNVCAHTCDSLTNFWCSPLFFIFCFFFFLTRCNICVVCHCLVVKDHLWKGYFSLQSVVAIYHFKINLLQVWFSRFLSKLLSLMEVSVKWTCSLKCCNCVGRFHFTAPLQLVAYVVWSYCVWSPLK